MAQADDSNFQERDTPHEDDRANCYLHYLRWTDCDREATQLIKNYLVEMLDFFDHGIKVGYLHAGLAAQRIILQIKKQGDVDDTIQRQMIRRCEEIQGQTMALECMEDIQC